MSISITTPGLSDNATLINPYLTIQGVITNSNATEIHYSLYLHITGVTLNYVQKIDSSNFEFVVPQPLPEGAITLTVWTNDGLSTVIRFNVKPIKTSVITEITPNPVTPNSEYTITVTII